MVDEINDPYSTCIRQDRVMHRGRSLEVAVCFLGADTLRSGLKPTRGAAARIASVI